MIFARAHSGPAAPSRSSRIPDVEDRHCRDVPWFNAMVGALPHRGDNLFRGRGTRGSLVAPIRPCPVAAVGEVTLILGGWSLSQYPNLITPDVTIFNVAAPAITLRPACRLDFTSPSLSFCSAFSRAQARKLEALRNSSLPWQHFTVVS